MVVATDPEYVTVSVCDPIPVARPTHVSIRQVFVVSLKALASTQLPVLLLERLDTVMLLLLMPTVRMTRSPIVSGSNVIWVVLFAPAPAPTGKPAARRIVPASGKLVSTPTLPPFSSVPPHFLLTLDHVLVGVAAPPFPAPLFESPAQMYRLVEGAVAELTCDPVATPATIMPPLVLPELVTVGVALLPVALYSVVK